MNWKALFLLALFLLLGASSAQAQNIKVGEIVEARVYGSPGTPWDPKDTYQVKILEIKADEPKYKVRMLTSGGGNRDGYAYSWNVRRAKQQTAVDQYTPDFLVGSWNIGPGNPENTVDERNNGDGTRTKRIERSLIANDNLLVINANGTYSWQVSSKNTIRGQWVAINDPDFPIMLKNAYYGENWTAGPFGEHRGAQYIRVRNVNQTRIFSGPRLGAAKGRSDTRASADSLPPAAAPQATAANRNKPQQPSRQDAAPVARAWRVGDKVEARSNYGDRSWNRGTIGETDGSRFKILYENSKPYHFEWVTSDQLRAPKN